jgi:hypothetical protein
LSMARINFIRFFSDFGLFWPSVLENIGPVSDSGV